MKQHSWSKKLTLLLVSSLTIMSIVTISPALPEMNEQFSELDNVDFWVKLTLTFPALWIALSSVAAGILIDRYGRLRFLWVAMILYAVAGTAGFWLDDLFAILISRAILGIAVGITMTIVVTLIADYFDGMQRQKFIGIQVAFMSLGGILFIGLGGVLADISWRFPFLIYAFSLVIMPMAVLYLDEPERITSDMTQQAKSTSPNIIWLLFINVLVMWVLFFLIPVQIPFYLQELGVDKKSLVGAAIAVSTALSAVSSFSYSKIKDRFSFYTIFFMGYSLMGIGFIILALAQGYSMVVISMMFCGFGMGMMIPNTNMWVMKIAPPEIRGKEIGRLTTFWFMGQFLSPILMLPLVSRTTLSSLFMVTAGITVSIAFFFLIMFLILKNANSE